MHQRSLPVLLLTSLLVFAACRKEEAVPKPAALPPTTPSAMETASVATLKRLETQAVRWTARHAFGGGRTLQVETLQVPEGPRRFEFTVVGRDGSKGQLAKIIERDGYWYVTEGDTSAVYRPYQAPLQIPSLYIYLARSELQLFQASGYAELGKLLDVKKDVATFRAEFPEELKARLELMATAAEASDAGTTATEARKVIEDGLQTRIDLKTGVILRAGLPGAQTEIDGPHFFTTVPSDDSFAVGDLAPGLLASSVRPVSESLVMLAHCGAWQPGGSGCDLDTTLLELKSGALRRVPYARGTTLPGSFLPNQRTRVLVSSTDVNGSMRPAMVDLVDGSQGILGGRALYQGISLFPTASPDGTRAVVTWLPELEARDQARVMLFDLQGGEARPVGAQMEHSHVQWLPDGQSLLLAVRQPTGEAGETEPSIAKLALDGKLEVLRKGDQPLVLGESGMLFFDRAAKQWMRAKLDGTSATRFGDGHATLSSPTLAPDRASLVFLKLREDGVQVPVQVDIQGKTVTPLMVEGGLWAWPRW